jgi:hypothetical protein
MSKVQLPHKIVHEELALQWVVSSGSARELAMANSWYEHMSLYTFLFPVLSIILVSLQSSVCCTFLSLNDITVHTDLKQFDIFHCKQNNRKLVLHGTVYLFNQLNNDK